MSEARALVIELRFTLTPENLAASYRQAISPDGGWEGTFNEHIQQIAEGLIEDASTFNTSWDDCQTAWHLE